MKLSICSKKNYRQIQTYPKNKSSENTVPHHYRSFSLSNSEKTNVTTIERQSNANLIEGGRLRINSLVK